MILIPFLIKDTLVSKIPWMTFSAIRWIDKKINKKFVIFEWGSGGSSLFFEKRCQKLFSVEHDKNWYQKVKLLISKKTNYKLIKPSIGRGYRSNDENFKGLSFKDYCCEIDSYPNNYFDLISIDGRARNDCIKHAVSKIKKGGYIIVDNSDRAIYSKGMNLLQNFKKIDFEGNGPLNNYVWKTSVFQNI